MQRFDSLPPSVPQTAPLVLLFERNDAVAVPLLGLLRGAGYDVRSSRIPVEVFDTMQREPVDLILIDLGNAAANRREFWVGLDTQRRNRPVHVVTFRYLSTGDTGNLDEGVRVARADVEIHHANSFDPLIEAVRVRLPHATPVQQWPSLPGSIADMSLPSLPSAAPPSLPSQMPPAAGEADSPFAQPLQENPFKRQQPRGPFSAFRQPEPAAPPQPAANWPPPSVGAAPVGQYANAFGQAAMPTPAVHNGAPRQPDTDDSWTPPEPPRKGIAYRGYEDEPLSPDDPRIEGNTSPVPVIQYAGVNRNAPVQNDRALSTVLMDSAVMAPQRLDALKSIQETLATIGMTFSISELAMLFRFLTPDQLLAALLVSRNLVTAEQIASLGRIKQELQATGKDYDLGTMLIMFDVLPAEQVRQLQNELA